MRNAACWSDSRQSGLQRWSAGIEIQTAPRGKQGSAARCEDLPCSENGTSNAKAGYRLEMLLFVSRLSPTTRGIRSQQEVKGEDEFRRNPQVCTPSTSLLRQ